MCRFKAGHKLHILDKDTSPYKEMGLARYFPDDNGLVKFEETFKSCAVVGSSSYMNDSSLGSEIDSHEAVLRFNMAPTEGFAKDVGTKTTIRLINGQVLEERNANKFANLVNNETLFLWKAGPYNGNLVRWYADKKVRSFFVDYVYWRHRHAQKVPYIIHPSSLWSAWDLIQEHTNNTIRKEVPTSGFTGILIMLRLCQKVDIYGYLTPDNSSCHYFPMDRPCAPLSWHPVSSERDVLKRMSEGVVQDPLASDKGLVTLTGFPATLC
ncbi:beta-galactoside alpha-2,6-sialyltransferase 2-like isoform X2 [Ptychodera flava]